MTRKPDDVKKGLNDPIPVHFHIGDPEPRLTPLAMVDLEGLHTDALALIQQLESKLECSQMTIDGLTATLLKCDTVIKQLQAERDAAVADLKVVDVCTVCKHDGTRADVEPCSWCSSIHTAFEWRGVQKEEAK